MNVPDHAHLLAPAIIDTDDLMFFSEHPERRYRARKPFSHELKRLKLAGQLPPLKPGREHAVIVSRLGAGHILTGLYTLRCDPPGRLPDNDAEIHSAFTERAAQLEKENVHG